MYINRISYGAQCAMSLISRHKSIMMRLFVVALCSLFFVPSITHAADPKPTIKDEMGYSAKFVSQSDRDPIEMKAGETKTVTITFKNTGTATWNASGSRFISAYTMEPRERKSVFTNKTWKSSLQTNAITKSTKPGENAELTLSLTAPKIAGTYTEEFYLAAENYSWVKGGYFYLKIVVAPSTVSADVTTSTDEIAPSSTPALAAKRSFITKTNVRAVGGADVNFTIAYRNTGTQTWSTAALQAQASDISLFGDDSWQSQTVIRAQDVATAPGEFLRQKFTFRAPPKTGSYPVTFRLVVDGTVVGESVVTVVVTEDAPESYRVPQLGTDDVATSADEGEDDTPRLSEEPNIRVGLFVVSNIVRVKVDAEYRVVVDGVDVATLASGKTIKLSHDTGTFSARIGSMRYTGSQSLDLIPKDDASAVFTILSYDRIVSWKGPKNFNAYRGRLEMRKGQKSDDVWVVNELLFSDYAKGIGENSNGSPMEYLKAQSVAQVSYAYAIVQSDKYGIFDVVATTGDQLYLGYNCELLMPRFVEATEATRGYMVTYNNEVVITPYFANTNGKTKSWVSVWGGSAKPWLVPVVANYDKGKKLFGHGVGMSQLDAAARADKEGLSWKELLKYYYTGTKVSRIF